YFANRLPVLAKRQSLLLARNGLECAIMAGWRAGCMGYRIGGRGWPVGDLATVSVAGGVARWLAGSSVAASHHPPAAAEEPFRAQQADKEEEEDNQKAGEVLSPPVGPEVGLGRALG